MPLESTSGIRHRMPVVFGPMPGPRQRLGGGRYDHTTARIDSYATSFLTEPKHLEKLLAPGFSLAGEPVVTVEFTYISEVQWLAGRGYNTLAIRFPTRFQGSTETAEGPFVAVVWENKADPIITGREELGYAKLFSDLPAPCGFADHRRCSASWEGHTFAEMELTAIEAVPPAAAGQSAGMLHYRYIPRVGCPGQADFEGAVITPPVASVDVLAECQAVGRVNFVRSTWEQLPTFGHIVNALADMPVLAYDKAIIRTVRRDVENTQQRILT